MDPIAALAGTTQLSSYCQEVNSTILQWVNQVKTVDGSITWFKESIQALQLTYDNLASSLQDAVLLVAARETNNFAGGNLWGQVSTILSDCQRTVLYVRQQLQYLQHSSKKIALVLKAFADSLNYGEFFVVKDTLKLLEQNLACAKAMMNITLQIRQPNLNEATRQYIARDLQELAADVNDFCSKLASVAQSSRSADIRTYNHLEEFNTVANNFLTIVGVSLLNDGQNPASQPINGDHHTSRELTHTHSHSQSTAITALGEDTEIGGLTDRSLPSPNRELLSDAGDEDSDNDNDIELELISEYMANGQADLEMEDFASAEENFRAALETVQSTTGNKTTQYSAGEITLMMVDCYLKQDKEEDAMELLEPIANGTDGPDNDAASVIAGSVRGPPSPALGLQHKANHLLAVVFLKRLDFLAAEKRAKLALKGRRKVHGQGSPMTLETVQLLIDIYTAKGDKINARAYRRFLDPPTATPKARPVSMASAAPAPTPSQVASPQIRPAEVLPLANKSQPVSTPTPGNRQIPLPTSHIPVATHQMPTQSAQIPLPTSQIRLPPQQASPPTVQTPVQQPQVPLPAASNPFQSPQVPLPASHIPLPTRSFPQHTATPSMSAPQVQQRTNASDRNNVSDNYELPATFSPLMLSPLQTPTVSPSFTQTPSTATSSSAPNYKASKLLGLANINEHQVLPTMPPMEPRIPINSTPTAIDSDTSSLRNAFGATRKSTWSSFSSRLSISKFDTAPRKSSDIPPVEPPPRLSSSTAFKQLANTQKRIMSMGNNFSFSDYIKKPEAADSRQLRSSMGSPSAASVTTINTIRTAQPEQSTQPIQPTPRTRHGTASKFAAIKSMRQDGKKLPAIEAAIKLLREYDPEGRIMSVREAELRKNMKESHKGLAGTGYGYAPIHYFCEQRQEAAFEVELLIEQGVDVNAVAYTAGMAGTDPFSPLQRAVQLGHIQIVRLLINAGVQLASPVPYRPDRNAEVSEPLLIACMSGYVQITYLLLTAGAAKVVKGFPSAVWHGNSLLHEAAWRGDVEMVKILLLYSKRIESDSKRGKAQQGPNPSLIIGTPGQQDRAGATPIMYAIDIRDCTDPRMRRIKEHSRKKCLQLLLENGVDGDLQSQTYRESVAKMLSLKWTFGPGTGHSIFCYADDSGDEELMRVLDPFRYQVSPGMRCSATPRCSPSNRTSTHHMNGAAEAEGSLRTVALPMFPELMSESIITGLPPDVNNTEETSEIHESIVSYTTLSPIFENGTVISNESPEPESGRDHTFSVVSNSSENGGKPVAAEH